jgi:hypothetical protein
MQDGEYTKQGRQTKDQPRREGQAIMTTDGMKRRDFLRTVTTLVGAVALGGSASLLSGCGGNGGNPPGGPTLNPVSSPGGVAATPSAIKTAVSNAGATGVTNVTVAAATDSTGAAIPPLSAGTTSAAVAALQAAANGLPASAQIATFSFNGNQIAPITVATFNADVAAYFNALATLPSSQAPQLAAGDTIKILTFTLSNGQTISSPAIVSPSGQIVFDTASVFATPSPSDSTDYVKQNAQSGAVGKAATTAFNPVTGTLIYSNTVTGTANSEANGNLNATTPVTNISYGTPITGPGVNAGTPQMGTPTFKAVAANTVANSRQAGSTCVVIVFTVSVTITLFGITITVTITIVLTICSTTSGGSGNGG